MIIHWIIVIAMTYVAYVVFKNLWSDGDGQKNGCARNCNKNSKNATQSTYTYTVAQNKTTSTTKL